MSELPIACELTTAALRERSVWLREQLTRHVSGHEWLPEGLALRLVYSPESLAILAELVQLEARCCAFLRFELRVSAGTGLLELDLTGPPGTRAFLEQLELVRG